MMFDLDDGTIIIKRDSNYKNRDCFVASRSDSNCIFFNECSENECFNEGCDCHISEKEYNNRIVVGDV